MRSISSYRFAATTALLLAAAVTLPAQVSGTRADYRELYEKWRGLDPVIEQDAGQSTANLRARAQQLAEAATAYASQRSSYDDARAESFAAEQEAFDGLSGATRGDLAEPATMEKLVDDLDRTLQRMIASYGATNDPQLVRLRGALEQEQTALAGIREAIGARTIRTMRTDDLETSLRETAENGGDALGTMAEARQNAADALAGEAELWGNYYAALSGGATASPAAAPQQPADSLVNGPVTQPNRIPPVPLSRYTGEWLFPQNGLFHGAQPASVQLRVSEADNYVTGSLSALFALPAGSPGDPRLTFTFQGPLQAERNQKFPLTTDEGVAGTIELIPGPAFNLLEVNFQTEPAENKVRAGNFILVKN